ncbi:MAG TPA: hypothetical protein VF438_01000 [Candidatus Paceibacterota bacterium]
MIEAATGAVFLMTSLYGAGHANAQTIATPANSLSTTAGAAITRTITDTKDVEAYVRQAYADTPILIEVARCESTFRQYDSATGQVVRGIVNKGDVGVMQINEGYHAEEAAKKGYDIYSVQGNVAFAKKLYEKFGTSPWSASKPCWSTANIARK